MSLRRYVPSGCGGPLAIVAVLGASLIAGVVTGVIEGVVSRWISLFFVFPLLIGVAAGGVGAVIVGKRKLRAPAIALICGFLGGAVGYAADHATSYVQFRRQVAASLGPDGDAPAMIDDLLKREVGAAGIVGYLKLAARTGVKIKRTASYDKDGLTFSGTAAWILWAAELLTAAAVAGAITLVRARAPFCEACNTWFGTPRTFASGGSDSKQARKEMQSALEAGDAVGAASAFHAQHNARRTLHLTECACPRCGNDTYVRLARITGAKKPRYLDSWLMTKPELDELKAALGRVAQRPDRPYGHA